MSEQQRERVPQAVAGGVVHPSQLLAARRLAQHGCPTETDRAGYGVCFYCRAPNYREERGLSISQEIQHEADCLWPPFEEVFGG